jgi:TolB protein
MTPPLTIPAHRLSLVILSLAATLAACSDSATGPVPTPDPLPDTATYDLVFEQSAFPLNASELRIRRAGDTQSSLLFGRQLLGVEPSVSADGRVLVYQGFGGAPGDDSDLWIVRANHEPERLPLPLGDVEFAPSISPDGTRLAYIRLGEDGYTHLFVSRVDGTERRELGPEVQGPGRANSTPAWSPDGTRLAFSSGAPGAMRIALINADGTGFRSVSAGVSGGSDIDAAWSPDGTRLAFVRTPSPGASDLVILTLATGVERAFGLGRRNRQPAWAPNGASIVFSSTMEADDGDTELYSVKPDGTALTRLTDDDRNQRHPIWVKRT